MKNLFIFILILAGSTGWVSAQTTEEVAAKQPSLAEVKMAVRQAAIEDAVQDAGKQTDLEAKLTARGATFRELRKTIADLTTTAIRLREAGKHERAYALGKRLEAKILTQLESRELGAKEKARLETALGELYKRIFYQKRKAADAFERASLLNPQNRAIEKQRKRLERYATSKETETTQR